MVCCITKNIPDKYSILVTGLGVRTGHYTTVVQKDSDWWEMDDTSVTKVDAVRGLLSDSSYLLFYESVAE